MPEVTLKALEHYARVYQEREAPKGFDLQAQRPALLARAWLWLSGHLLFTRRRILDLLRCVTQKREEEGMRSDLLGDRAIRRVLLFGDQRSAFHSLLRNLRELCRLGYLDESLVWKSDETACVFLGNVIGPAPFALETLMVVLWLLQKSPGHVFYLQGQFEDPDGWLDGDLRLELSERGDERFYQSAEQWITRLFRTLPPSMQLPVERGERVRLTSCSQDSSDIFAGEIVGVDRQLTYLPSLGLDLLPAQGALTRWGVFSSPTLRSQRLYQFFYDSFAFFEPDASILEHHFRYRGRGQYQVASFDFFSGQEAKQRPPLAPPLVFGCTLDLSKSAKVLGTRLQVGMMLAFNGENQTGGIGGRYVKPVFLDDEYTPIKARRNVERFLSAFEIPLIFSSLGTPTVESFLPVAESQGALVLFPCSGASMFRRADLRHVIHLRTSYTNEAKALVSYAINLLKLHKFAIFFQDDSYGRSALEGAISEFSRYGIEQWLEVSYLRNNPNVAAAAAKIVDFDPDVILFFSTLSPSRELVHLLSVQRLVSKVLMGITFLTDAFRDYLKTLGLSCVMARVVPNPRESDLEIARRYRSACGSGACYSVESFEGYINAAVFLEALKEIGEPWTAERLSACITEWRPRTIQGLHLNFNEETRELFQEVWVDAGEAWVRGGD